MPALIASSVINDELSFTSLCWSKMDLQILTEFLGDSFEKYAIVRSNVIFVELNLLISCNDLILFSNVRLEFCVSD